MVYNLVDPDCRYKLDNELNCQLIECNNEYDLYTESLHGEQYIVPKDVFAFLFGDPKENPRAQVYRTSKIKDILYQDKYDSNEFIRRSANETLLNVYVLLATNKFTNVKFVSMDASTELILREYLERPIFGFVAEKVSTLEYTLDFKDFETEIEIVRGVSTSSEPLRPEYIFKYIDGLGELQFIDKLPGDSVPKSNYIHMYKPEDLLRNTKFIPFNAVAVPITKPRGDIHIVSQDVTPDVILDDVIKGDYSDTHHTLYLTNSDLATSKGTALYFPLLKFIEQDGNTIFVSKEWTDFMVEFAKRSDRTITIVFE